MDFNSTLAEFKGYVDKIVRDRVSISEIKQLAEKIQIQLDLDQDFSYHKKIVLVGLLEQILRDETGRNDQFQILLQDTQKLLNLPRQAGYNCTYVGCFFVKPQHRDYIKHLEDHHFIDKSFLCNYRKECLARFSSIQELKLHISSAHKQPSSSTNQGSLSSTRSEVSATISSTKLLSIAQPCRCNLTSCGNKLFPNVKKLMIHYNQDHHLERRHCIFEGCDKFFPPQFVSRNHFGQFHTKLNKIKLKNEFLINPQGEDVLQDDNCNEAFEDMDIDHEYEDENVDEDMGEDVVGISNDDEEEVNITKMVANFYNNLAYQKMIPQSTIQTIVEEFLSLLQKSKEIKLKKISKMLSDASLPANIISKVQNLCEKDEIISAHHKLDSPWKREKFIINNFDVVLPEEIILNEEGIKNGEKKESFQYVPLVKSMKVLLQDPTYLKVMEEVKNSDVSKPGVLEDIKDGRNYQSIKYFQDNPQAKCGMLYSDAIEVVNPLGAGRGKYKLVQVYWTLVDLPKKYRTRIDQIQLSITVQEKLLRKYGYKKIYFRLIQDMLKLEREGIQLSVPIPHTMKVSFMIHVGDNLEQMSLGGFSMSFSSGHICRFCLMKYKNLQENIHNCPEFWTEELYEAIMNNLDPIHEDDNVGELITIGNLGDHLFDEIDEPELPRNVRGTAVVENDSDDEEDQEDDSENSDDDEEESEVESRGLRENSRCPFNILSSFHATHSLVIDFMHDYCEGVIPLDLLSSVKILISKKFISEASYNDSLKTLSYGRSDRPEPISSKPNVKKLKGKAMANLCHLRHFGLIIKRINPDSRIYEEDSYKLMLLLISITERLMAPVIEEYELDSLEEDITMYLDLRKKIHQEHPSMMGKAKPKHHYGIHYPESISKFGPVTAYWTAR